MFKTQNIGLLNHNEWNTATVKNDRGKKSLQIRIVLPYPTSFLLSYFFFLRVSYSAAQLFRQDFSKLDFVGCHVLKGASHQEPTEHKQGDSLLPQPTEASRPAGHMRPFATAPSFSDPQTCSAMYCCWLAGWQRTLQELSNGTLGVFPLAPLSKTPQSLLKDIQPKYYQSLLVGICYHRGLQSSYSNDFNIKSGKMDSFAVCY